MAASNKKKLEALRARLSWITKRYEESGFSLTWVCTEIEAISWALPILEQHVAVQAYLRDKALKEKENASSLLQGQQIPTAELQADLHDEVGRSAQRLDCVSDGRQVHDSPGASDLPSVPEDLDS